MELELATYNHWDDTLWDKLGPIYREAFLHGAKPEKILRNMVIRGIARLHAGLIGGEAAAMAITGLCGAAGNAKLIIDYLAVRQDLRGHGLGGQFLEKITTWAVHEHQVRAIIIETEAEDTEINRIRLAFWERCGFIATPYVHQYKWVSEPYRALALPLSTDFAITDDGRSLFRDITAFHEKSFRPRPQ